MISVTVAVCTFRRASLEATLHSLAGLTWGDGSRLRVIVADNDDLPVRQAGVVALGQALGLDLRYVHAPARNISVARNACLAHCETDWLAFVDDDEQVEPDWLARLAAASGTAEIVFGTCRAVYPAAAPRWARAGDFHSNRLAGNDAAWNGYTSNVLIAMPFVRRHGLRFAPELGQTGGEDTLFFLTASQCGARFNYVPDAVVTEPVDPARLGLGWLARRRFRAGQVHWLVLGQTGGRLAGGAGAALKLVACLGLAAAAAARPEGWRGGVLRAMLHAGVVAAALGLPVYREYAAPEGR